MTEEKKDWKEEAENEIIELTECEYCSLSKCTNSDVHEHLMIQKALQRGFEEGKKEYISQELIQQNLSQIDWINLLKDAINNRKTSWNQNPVREWRNASDEIHSSVIKNMEKAGLLKNPWQIPEGKFYDSIKQEGRQERQKEILEKIDKVSSWYCNDCNLVLDKDKNLQFDNEKKPICYGCESRNTYGNIDTINLKEKILEG